MKISLPSGREILLIALYFLKGALEIVERNKLNNLS